MNKINYCYHTHTSRCHHAFGEDEQYVLSAISHGFIRLGFSDHVFLPGIIQSTSRGEYELLDNYLNNINDLKNKYYGQIDIKIGFEAEYSRRFLPYLKSLLANKKIDYLILGQHFNFDESDNPPYIKKLKEDHHALDVYVQQLLEAMNTRLFKYVAHPDLYVTMFKKWNEHCEQAAHLICQEAEKCHLPLEINLHAKRFWANKDYLIYPFDQFWQIASLYNLDVVIGYDAHHPDEFKFDIDFALDLINKYNLHLLKDYQI